ncbi:carbon-nitrogen hydrolase family protein [Labrys wisconsinensis]|uniref:carbon-nitrogen hydrolase family protein n=1 Tax=Labrys wisconsinensis TaxID=425677 RepID=UPI0027D85C42|nr:carbon-nitrogen hydrolase family protein [Labrys wisconsinensis]
MPHYTHMGVMKIAVAQIGSVRGAALQNAETVAGWLERAAADGCAFVAFPECGLTGYVFHDRAGLAGAAIPASGPEVALIVETCRRLAIHTVVGLFERDGERVYNTALLIGPQGVVGSHRKRHLPFLGGDRFADEPGGIEPSVFDTPVGKIGIAICYEIRFPEVVRTLVLSGAEIVVLPTNWPAQSHILADLFTPVRAAENFVYFLAANRNDTEDRSEFMGSSQIVDPTGHVLVHAGTQTGLFAAEVDLNRSRDKRIVFESGEFEISPFRDRKPGTYRL